MGGGPTAVERRALVQPKRLEIDADDEIRIERLAERRIVDPRVFVDPASDLLLADDSRPADLASDLGTDQ